MLDALLDTAKLAPLLLVMHVLIEVFEYHAASKIKMNRLLHGKAAPLLGGAVGLIPQCGFSVVATNLYAKRHIRVGTLLAVYIATSDEAIPILLSSPESALKLLPLLGLKFAFAVGVGYLLNALTRKRALVAFTGADVTVPRGCHRHEIGEHEHADDKHEHDSRHERDHAELEPAAEADEAAAEKSEGLHGDCTAARPPEKKFDVACFVVHPLVHTLTVLGFLLAVNLLLGTVLYFVGEGALQNFMHAARWLQPLLAALVGLIPNCASSVVITQVYASGAQKLGGADQREPSAPSQFGHYRRLDRGQLYRRAVIDVFAAVTAVAKD